MREHFRRNGSGYLIAVGAALLVVLARFALEGWLGGHAQLLPFVLVVMAAGWQGGLRPALLATALGGVLGSYFFLEPIHSVWVQAPSDRAYLLVFLAVGVTVSGLCEALHSARRRSEDKVATQKQTEDRLREADQRKDEFLALLAHELRNPLAPIRNAVTVMRMAAVDDPDWQCSRDVIERQVGQLTRLVDDLLDVSRISRGKINLHREPLEMAAVVARAVESSRPLIDAHGHTLEVKLPDEPVRVMGDLTRLAQVVLNLLNNSAKYTPVGGHIRLAMEKETSWAVVRVGDTGMGIPADMLAKVFDLFTQVGRTLDRSEGGLGLGLTLVRRLTEMHGGTAEAFSDGPGRGSEFVLRLPLLATEQPAAEPEVSGGRQRQGPTPVARCVLVVDDNRDSADSLAMLLRLTGNDVRVAYDGRQALQVAEEFQPDVVLLDIGLPGMSGYDVARQMRRTSSLTETLLVALTGYGSEEDRRRSAEVGFCAHMVKPVDLAGLEDLLAGLGGDQREGNDDGVSRAADMVCR